MRTLKANLAALCLIALSGCDSGPTKAELSERVDELESENQELQAKVTALTDQLENARLKVTDVSEAADRVQSAASRFDGENWREVVSDVQSASSELDTAQDAAKEAVEDE